MIDICVEGLLGLVQHFAYRGSSHRRKSAARRIIDMAWLYIARLSHGVGEEDGVLLVQMISTYLRKEGSQHPVVAWHKHSNIAVMNFITSTAIVAGISIVAHIAGIPISAHIADIPISAHIEGIPIVAHIAGIPISTTSQNIY